MTQLKIDNVNKRMEVELMLAGEKEAIRVQVGKYELTPGGELQLSDISVSRAWMDILAKELAGKPQQIPPRLVNFLRLVL